MRFARLCALGFSALGFAACADREPVAPPEQPAIPPPSFTFTQYTLSGGPYGSAVTANGTAWIGQITGGTVSKMNVSAGTFTGPYVTGPTGNITLPVQVTKNGDGSRIYVASFDERAADSGLVVSINTATGGIVDSVRVMGDATGLIATPTGDTVFVGTTDGPIYKIALASRTIITSVSKSSPLSYHFAWNQNRTLLYASATNQGVVYELNPTTLATVRTFATGNQPQAIVFSADWTKLFIPSEVSSVGVMVWDVASNSLASTITTNCRGYGAVRLPDNSKLYVSCTLDGKVVAVDPTTGALLATENVTGKPRELSYDSGTGKVIAPNENGWVDRVDVSAPPLPPPSGHYVAPNGSPTGLGTEASPWDLSTAFNGAGGQITAGETVWIRGGDYLTPAARYTIPTTVHGLAGAPITFRAYPGERPILRGAIGGSASHLRVQGDYIVLWGLEIVNTNTDRTTVRGDADIWNSGTHNRFINLIIHDGSVGFYNEENGGSQLGTDVEITGSIFYNIGYQGSVQGSSPDRGHGHALYLKNSSSADSVVVSDNIMFNQFSHGIHVYTELGSQLYNMKLRRNVSFNNGTLALWPADSTIGGSPGRNILVGGKEIATGAVVDGNMTYFSPDSAYGPKVNDRPTMGPNVAIGYQLLANGGAQVTNNYFVGGGTKVFANSNSHPLVTVGKWSSLAFSGNQFIPCPSSQSSHCTTPVRVISLTDSATSGTWSNNNHYRDSTLTAWRNHDGSRKFQAWRSKVQMVSNDLASVLNPTVTKTFVNEVRSQGQPTGRANIVVYNWGNNPSVSVNLSGIVPSGKSCQIRNVLALDVVLPGCTSGMVSIGLTAVTPPVPIGQSVSHAPPTGTRFNVYVVDWIP